MSENSLSDVTSNQPQKPSSCEDSFHLQCHPSVKLHHYPVKMFILMTTSFSRMLMSIARQLLYRMGYRMLAGVVKKSVIVNLHVVVCVILEVSSQHFKVISLLLNLMVCACYYIPIASPELNYNGRFDIF